MKKTIDFKKPITTRGGSEVKFYEIFNGRYINGSYYESSEDIWYPCSWGINGKYGDQDVELDLINVKEYRHPDE